MTTAGLVALLDDAPGMYSIDPIVEAARRLGGDEQLQGRSELAGDDDLLLVCPLTGSRRR